MLPNEPTSEWNTHRHATRRVRRLTGFKIHALVYMLVNLGLLATNIATGGGHWHWFPFLGWGLGLLIHGLVTFSALRGNDATKQR